MMTNKNGDFPTLMDLLDDLDARKGVEVTRVRLPKEMGKNLKLSVLAFVYDEEE